MDIDGKDFGDAVLQVEGQGVPPFQPQPVGHPVGFEGMETLVMEERLRYPAGRRVPATIASPMVACGSG